jgi:hypothetical protein
MVGFLFNIYTYMEKITCINPYCKAIMEVPDNWQFKECPKCINTSGNVTWTEKKYEGPKWDGQPHPIEIRMQTPFDKKKRW